MTTKEIPVAKGLPLIGNLVPLIQNPYQFFVKTYQKLGPLYRVYVPGRVLTVLGGPEANVSRPKTFAIALGGHSVPTRSLST
ncbi:MAG: cytochrome P450 [Iphinoe sp. HA4291-MV1]|jgi:hypothetical protein|nr:cytochrome P450 [Iphinoe sp. HA4291-MV1]